MILAELVHVLSADGWVANHEMRGCSDSEIEELESKLGANLPEAYREFLSTMGHQAGRFLVGSDCFFADLPMLQVGARDLLDDEGVDFPIGNFIVFFGHQGYQFAFFDPKDGSDPSVWTYEEGQSQPTKTKMRFSRFMLRCANDLRRQHVPK